MRKCICLIALLLCVSIHAQQKRVALIIGNEEYSGHFSTLHTPLNDAEAMANTLYALGFDTIVGKNVNRDAMSKYLDKFHSRANGAELALFYYSGHAGTNGEDLYLAPSGSYKRQATLTADCYPFSTIKKEIKRIGAPLKFVIIDACRSSIDDSKSRIKNFTPATILKRDSREEGTIYWYATGVNKDAQTGSGKYSIFTASLLNHIGDFDDLGTVQRRVFDEVTRADEEQKPDYDDNTNVSSKIYLNPQKKDIHKYVFEGKDYYSFETTPSDATITISGKNFKSGERFILEYGKNYDVSISAQGYASWNEKITATPYKSVYKIFLDELAEAKLSIQSNVDGATVYFDKNAIGSTPLYKDIDTYAGPHDIRVEKREYYSYSDRPILKAGAQILYAKLSKQPYWPLDWDDDGTHMVSYHFSPKYQIGVGYLYRPEDFRLSFGGIISASPGFFRGWSSIFSQEQSVTINLEESSSWGDITTETMHIDGADEPYSNFIDPYNEAKHYDASVLLLANMGFNPCNGLMLEAGIGAGYHQDRYHMDHTYFIDKTIRTNTVTGEVTESLDYQQQSSSKWYKKNDKWSPAMRLGTRLFIPLDRYKEKFIILGGGYTYLPMNHKFSSWDACISYGWAF